MPYQTIQEGSALIKAPKLEKISKELPVFYNPAMKLNRDISIWLLNTIEKEKMQICLPLAATGVRGIRFVKELQKGKIKTLVMNDRNHLAYKLMQENLKLNGIKKGKNLSINKKDATILLMESAGFDYIDIDPFGTPNPFLDSALAKIAREGILAVTATDTSALSGTYPRACLRKYWAMSLRNELKHEIGIRILIRKVQLVAAHHRKAAIPLLSYADQHYMRVFFSVAKGKEKADTLLKQHQYFLYCDGCMGRKISEENGGGCSCGEKYTIAGPLWTGMLWNEQLLKKANSIPLLQALKEEATIAVVGFYDLHKIAEQYKRSCPKMDWLLERVREKGYAAARTHFTSSGIKTDMPLEEFLRLW
ncbi:tRNA (guanine(10)-N(2))-dimethyltransferase [Candidatus Woesearchaeota archaeon]|nr:tRNA (guanine(10)-N(2))-dimethyltransferase [Candidatus Woesearchaeota archaeon]